MFSDGPKVEDVTQMPQQQSGKLTQRQRTIFISLMTLFNFWFAGLEGSFKNFIPAYGTSCPLHLTRSQIIGSPDTYLI